MILPGLKRELGLQEEFFAGDNSIAYRLPYRFTNGGFKVVLALIGGIDAPKALLDCLAR